MGKQSDKWHETRKSKLDELFQGKSFHVVSEEKLDEPLETPLGYKTKNGYWIRSGNTKLWVGKTLLRQIAEKYNAVELPEPKRRGRPKKKPLEQAEKWADRGIPNNAQQITQPGPTYVNPNQNESL